MGCGYSKILDVDENDRDYICVALIPPDIVQLVHAPSDVIEAVQGICL